MTKRFGFTLAEGATHVAMPNSKLNFGFTLAEVLITLGIIGVVAAMTMPTLMNQTNGAQYKAAYKKALSAIGQAITLNVALDGANFADTVAGTTGKTDKGTDGDSVGSILNSRMNIVKAATAAESGYDEAAKTKIAAVKSETCTTTEGKETCTEATNAIAPDTFLFFNDGIMFSYKAADAKGCIKDDASGVPDAPCYGVIDVNGTKGPNKVVACDKDTSGQTCKVSNPTDIYPVVFYNQTVLPASSAAKAVLYGK